MTREELIARVMADRWPNLSASDMDDHMRSGLHGHVAMWVDVIAPLVIEEAADAILTEARVRTPEVEARALESGVYIVRNRWKQLRGERQ